VECDLTPSYCDDFFILVFLSLIIFNMSVFLGKEWNSFHLLGKKLDYLHLRDFLKYECELYLKQPLMSSHVLRRCE